MKLLLPIFFAPILLIGIQNFCIIDGWKGLKPFVNTREQVEAIYGKAIRSDVEELYRNDDSTLAVVYSGVPCSREGGSKSRFNIPKQTVLNYRVYLKSGLPLKDLSFEAEDFERIEDPHLREEFIHDSPKLGITFRTVLGDDGTEKVVRFVYVAPPSLSDKVRCDKR